MSAWHVIVSQDLAGAVRCSYLVEAADEVTAAFTAGIWHAQQPGGDEPAQITVEELGARRGPVTPRPPR